jgi:hypothetical protein
VFAESYCDESRNLSSVGPDWKQTHDLDWWSWDIGKREVLSRGRQLAKTLLAGGHPIERLLAFLKAVELDGVKASPRGDYPAWDEARVWLWQLELQVEGSGFDARPVRAEQAEGAGAGNPSALPTATPVNLPVKPPPPSEAEANILIRKYLNEHPKDYSIRKAAEATGISTGRISSLPAWIARPPKKVEGQDRRSNRRERQLTEAILVNVGIEADPSDQASLREAAWNYLEKEAKDENERQKLKRMSEAERENVIASVIDHFDKQIPE